MRNLVIITSCIKSYDYSIFSIYERYVQLLKTIDSIINKVPQYYIIILEGSYLTFEQEKELLNKGVENIYYYNVQGLQKSVGEITMLLSYFKSDSFKNLENINTITKLSGRYFFTDDYIFNENFAYKMYIQNTWSGHGLCDTRFYRFPIGYVNIFVKNLQIVHDSPIFIDIEHSFFEYQVFPIQERLDKLNVNGQLAPNGQWTND